MKQKMRIKVQMACNKCKTKALEIAAGASGVVSVAAEGDKALVVTGSWVDPVALTATLRKKLGIAILLSVEEIKDQPPEQPGTEGGTANVTPVRCPYVMPPPPFPPYYSYPQPQYCIYEIPSPDPYPPCSIM